MNSEKGNAKAKVFFVPTKYEQEVDLPKSSSTRNIAFCVSTITQYWIEMGLKHVHFRSLCHRYCNGIHYKITAFGVNSLTHGLFSHGTLVGVPR